MGIIVSCRRVVLSTGSLTGSGGGLDRKRQVLEFEARGRRPGPSSNFFDGPGIAARPRTRPWR
ncbi:MGMT family protein [Streptomyces cucumeris]|uniref:MGMT family protein n=1 Tax=Streptomyces cucumeris TaxID=2962890 RepID=UPI003D75212D